MDPATRIFPVFFGLAILCFFLPFGTVACSDQSVEVTGIQLVTRTVPDSVIDPSSLSAIEPEETLNEMNLQQEVEDNAFVQALLALLAPVIGLVLSIWKPHALGKGLLAALGGVAALLSLPATAYVELVDELELGGGFICALVLEALLAAAYAVRLGERRASTGAGKGLRERG